MASSRPEWVGPARRAPSGTPWPATPSASSCRVIGSSGPRVYSPDSQPGSTESTGFWNTSEWAPSSLRARRVEAWVTDRSFNMRRVTTPLILIAALFVLAGGYVHLREWQDTYRSLPSIVPGRDVVRIGFP